MKLDRQLLPALALLLAAAAWGSTVAVAKGAYEVMSPVDLTISRLLLTGLCLLIPFLPRLRMKKRTLIQGIILGAVFNFGLAIQLIGLEFTAPSLSGFITASYVVFTAIITAVFLKQPPGRHGLHGEQHLVLEVDLVEPELGERARIVAQVERRHDLVPQHLTL